MTDDELKQAAKNLLSDKKELTPTARLREIFDDVEAALKAGMRQEDVYKKLHEKGLNMSFVTFRNTIYILRKERKGESKSKKQTPIEEGLTNHKEESKDEMISTGNERKEVGLLKDPHNEKFKNLMRKKDDENSDN